MTDKTVLITGGTGTIGESLVRRLVTTPGFRVYFQYRTNSKMAEQLTADTGAVSIQADLRSPELTWVPAGVDILINNAGINISDALLEDVTDANFCETMEVNLSAPFRLIRFVVPGMKKRRWGRIVNISSVYGLAGSECNAPYVASKFALEGLTRAAARELALYGVTVNCVAPGAVQSALLSRLIEREAVERSISTEAVFDEYVALTPAKRLARADDIVAAVAYLISAEHVTGTSLVVDGGQLA